MYKICKRCLTCNTQHCSGGGGGGVNLNYISSPKTRSVPNVFTRIVCMRKIYMRIIREREKNKKKIDMSEGQCALEKIIMLIITLPEKKNERKNLLLTK